MSLISDTHRRFASDFKRFCLERIQPCANEETGQATLRQNWLTLKEWGFFELFHPEVGRFWNADATMWALALEALGYVCPSTAFSASVSTFLSGRFLRALGTADQVERWLPPIAKGDRICLFGCNEASAGSEVNYQTEIRGVEGKYFLTGEKQCITNGCTADVGLIQARTRDCPQAKGQYAFAIVDLTREGIVRQEIPKMGLPGISFASLSLSQVEVDLADILWDLDVEKVTATMSWGPLGAAAITTGLSTAAYDRAMAYARERPAFGQPLLNQEVVHARLARALHDIEGARLLLWNAAASKVRGDPASLGQCHLAKIHATESAIRTCDAAMRTAGGWGWSKLLEFERMYRDALGFVPVGLTNDRMIELLACKLLGVNGWAYPEPVWLEALRRAV